MLRHLTGLFRRPSLDLGSLGRKARSHKAIRSEHFASYLASHNRRSLNTDRQDALLAGRRLMRVGLNLCLLALAVWILVESASAIGVF